MSMGLSDNVRATPPSPPAMPEIVAPGIWRIALPVPFPPGSVNSYVLAGAGEWCLVDAGMGTPETNAALQAGLAVLGVTYADISTLVLTHAHPDHIGAAADIANAMATPHITMLALEAANMAALWRMRSPADLHAMQAMHARAGLSPDEIAASTQSLLRMVQRIAVPPAAAITTTTDGAILRLAGRDWQVIWTPGHADGHMCLCSDQILIAGDHILPTISPNVSFTATSRPDPIQDYLDGLARLEALELATPLVLPGHGAPFTRLHERSGELRASCLRRSRATMATLRTHGAPMLARDVMVALFARRLVNSTDRTMALGETLAHLEHLRRRGHITATDVGTQTYYREHTSA